MKIHLRTHYTPLAFNSTKIDIHPTNRFADFVIDDVRIWMIPKEMVVHAETEIDGNENYIQELKDIDKERATDSPINEWEKILNNAIWKVLNFLKHFYLIWELDENLKPQKQNFEWSIDKNNWFPFPDKYPSKWIPIEPIYVLDDNLLSWFPTLNNESIKPFFAFEYLHKAFIEKNVKYKWIYATTAAELAFKEFLVQFDKRTDSLMSYVPSPPIYRLYKDVLKDYTDEESPMYKELKTGAEKRNKIIHNPNTQPPSKRDTEKYLHQVQVAIMHLCKVLYKDFIVFNFFYELSKEKLNKLR